MICIVYEICRFSYWNIKYCDKLSKYSRKFNILLNDLHPSPLQRKWLVPNCHFVLTMTNHSVYLNAMIIVIAHVSSYVSVKIWTQKPKEYLQMQVQIWTWSDIRWSNWEYIFKTFIFAPTANQRSWCMLDTLRNYVATCHKKNDNIPILQNLQLK